MNRINLSQCSRAVLLVVGVLALGACTTRGSAMAQRAEVQNDIARQEAGSQAAETDSRGTYLRVVAQMQQKGLYFASLAHIDALQQRWGADPESNLLRADAMRQTAQPEAARSLYLQLISTPMKARAAHGLGLLAGRVGDLATAVDYLNQSAQAAPTDAAVLNDLGYVLMQQGKWAEARVPLMKASELNAENLRVWSNVALYLTLDGKPDQAVAVMDGHKLPGASRAQIAELARAIQQRYGKPVAATAAPVTPDTPVTLVAALTTHSAAASVPAVTVPAPVKADSTVADILPGLSVAQPVAITAPVVLRDFGGAELTRLPATPNPAAPAAAARVAVQ